jgi:two-component system response regulator FixJ
MNRTIVLVDDHTAFRLSTAWLLGEMGYTVREFPSADGLLAALEPAGHWPGTTCVLLDVRMPGIDGLQLHDALLARGVRWPVVYMTGHGDVPLAVAAMRKGAFSFLEKPFRDAALEHTLTQAFAQAETQELEPMATASRSGPDEGGGSPPTHGVPPDRPTRAPAAAAGVRLTGREQQVLELVVQGKLNKTIADILGISIKTVELHRANMMQKMRARSITELMRRVLTSEEFRA